MKIFRLLSLIASNISKTSQWQIKIRSLWNRTALILDSNEKMHPTRKVVGPAVAARICRGIASKRLIWYMETILSKSGYFLACSRFALRCAMISYTVKDTMLHDSVVLCHPEYIFTFIYAIHIPMWSFMFQFWMHSTFNEFAKQPLIFPMLTHSISYKCVYIILIYLTNVLHSSRVVSSLTLYCYIYLLSL